MNIFRGLLFCLSHCLRRNAVAFDRRESSMFILGVQCVCVVVEGEMDIKLLGGIK